MNAVDKWWSTNRRTMNVWAIHDAQVHREAICEARGRLEAHVATVVLTDPEAAEMYSSKMAEITNRADLIMFNLLKLQDELEQLPGDQRILRGDHGATGGDGLWKCARQAQLLITFIMLRDGNSGNCNTMGPRKPLSRR